MTTYRVEYGDPFTVELQKPDEIVHILRSRHMNPGMSEEWFRKRLALEMCEWNGKPYYFGTNGKLAWSMIKNGLLVKIDSLS
jgi:hypothetical protein